MVKIIPGENEEEAEEVLKFREPNLAPLCTIMIHLHKHGSNM